jgi:hypothetical protein
MRTGDQHPCEYATVQLLPLQIQKLPDVLFRKFLNTTKFARMFNKNPNQENNKKIKRTD